MCIAIILLSLTIKQPTIRRLSQTNNVCTPWHDQSFACTQPRPLADPERRALGLGLRPHWQQLLLGKLSSAADKWHRRCTHLLWLFDVGSWSPPCALVCMYVCMHVCVYVCTCRLCWCLSKASTTTTLLWVCGVEVGEVSRWNSLKPVQCTKLSFYSACLHCVSECMYVAYHHYHHHHHHHHYHTMIAITFTTTTTTTASSLPLLPLPPPDTTNNHHRRHYLRWDLRQPARGAREPSFSAHREGWGCLRRANVYGSEILPLEVVKVIL